MKSEQEFRVKLGIKKASRDKISNENWLLIQYFW